MKALSVLICFATAICSIAQAAQAEDPALRKEIEAAYAKWNRYAMNKDMKGMLSMLHPSFIQVDANGKRTNYEDFKKAMSEMLPNCKDVKVSSKLENVTKSGAEAIAWITYNVSMKMKQGNKWGPMSFKGRFSETLRRTPQGWQFVFSQDLPGTQ